MIIGLGPIGCMMIDLARTMGAEKVIGIQRSKHQMEIARQYEADRYIFSEEGDAVKEVFEETGGRGAEYCGHHMRIGRSPRTGNRHASASWLCEPFRRSEKGRASYESVLE